MSPSRSTSPKIHLHKGDLPPGLAFPRGVAIDTETLGLSPQRDRLWLVQLSAGDGNAHVVQFAAQKYAAPNLKALLTDRKTLKIFHFARFDIAVLEKYLGVETTPVYCTKIASKLARTYTDPWTEGSVPGTGGRGIVQAAAELRLGGREAFR